MLTAVAQADHLLVRCKIQVQRTLRGNILMGSGSVDGGDVLCGVNEAGLDDEALRFEYGLHM